VEVFFPHTGQLSGARSNLERSCPQSLLVQLLRVFKGRVSRVLKSRSGAGAYLLSIMG